MQQGSCVCLCERRSRVLVGCNGYRTTIFYPGGGSYKGMWLNNKHHGFGVKITKNGIAYKGEWVDGKRHGFGELYHELPLSPKRRLYVGEWKWDMRWGEGKQFTKDGTYFGFFRKNKRHGIGIRWYADGSLYVGEWQADLRHGSGAFFTADGNRYEGHYAYGLRNGEGTYYYLHTGIVKKGTWESNECKSAIVMDGKRNQADVKPTEYPIPHSNLYQPDTFVRHLFHKHMQNANLPHVPYKSLEQTCIYYVKKISGLLILSPRAVPTLKTYAGEVDFPCYCKMPPIPSKLAQQKYER